MNENAFDQRLDRWRDEQQTPWAQLKYRLVADTLRDMLPPAPARILDAGGGNGVEALALARQGYRVTLLDSSAAMLAEARQAAINEGLGDHCTIIQGELGQLGAHVPPGSCDAALCHNVLQYVPDVPLLLAGLAAALRPGGLLSLVSVNRHSVPYQAAFLHHDLERALHSLDDRQQVATIFNAPMTLYTAEEVAAMLARQGFTIVAHIGIRCICDYWGTNAEKQRPEVMAQIEALERRLMHISPPKTWHATTRSSLGSTSTPERPLRAVRLPAVSGLMPCAPPRCPQLHGRRNPGLGRRDRAGSRHSITSHVLATDTRQFRRRTAQAWSGRSSRR